MLRQSHYGGFTLSFRTHSWFSVTNVNEGPQVPPAAGFSGFYPNPFKVIPHFEKGV